MKKLRPQNLDEAESLIFNILNQGDSRYNSIESEAILADFLIKEAISLEEKDIPLIEYSDKEDPKDYLYNTQWAEKRLAKELLKREGFQDSEIYFERRFLGSQPDILVESNNKIIVVECCSCRVSKIISFLEKIDEVWIVTRGEDPNKKRCHLDSEMQWFIFKKGRAWQEVFSDFQKKNQDQLKKVKNPLDRL